MVNETHEMYIDKKPPKVPKCEATYHFFRVLLKAFLEASCIRHASSLPNKLGIRFMKWEQKKACQMWSTKTFLPEDFLAQGLVVCGSLNMSCSSSNASVQFLYWYRSIPCNVTMTMNLRHGWILMNGWLQLYILKYTLITQCWQYKTTQVFMVGLCPDIRKHWMWMSPVTPP